jgi:Cof subfamily protein (haloacid dehalogenase superfamily)
MVVNSVFIDLDGTLLNSQHQISSRNLQCLYQLEQQGIVRVIATGRSLYSYRKVIASGFPADYLIFSSGAGVYDLKADKLLHATNLEADDIAFISKRLIDHKLDFTVHEQVPENHQFTYYQPNSKNRDFNTRISLYREHATKFSNLASLPKRSAQVIAVLPYNKHRFDRVAGAFQSYHVVRTTSPLDHKSMWLEIYPDNVSKGHGIRWLSHYLDLSLDHSFSLGNDYNDIDMLETTRMSVVVANAPAELRKCYPSTTSNDEDGLYHALKEIIPSFS